MSQHLIVAFSRQQLAWLFSGAVGALLLLGAYAGRRASRQMGARAQSSRDPAR